MLFCEIYDRWSRSKGNVMATGKCLCGGVSFEVEGDIEHMHHCHCSMCRKAHGASFATYADVPVERFRWISGSDLIVGYASSEFLERRFCKICGSVVPDGEGDTVSVPAGMLEGDIGSSEIEHILVTSKAPWHTIVDDHKQHDSYPGGGEEMPGPAAPATREGVVTGGCLCGAVEFEFTGEPEFMRNCHCSRCRRAKGAVHATNLFVAPEKLSFTKGSEHLVRFDLPGAKAFGHSFCDTCGSSLPRQAAGAPFVNVPAGSLDSDPGVRPECHFFYGSKVDWYTPEDELPKHDEMGSA